MNRLARVFPPAKIGDSVFRIEWQRGNLFVAEYRVVRMSVHQVSLVDDSGNELVVSGKNHLREFGRTESEAAMNAFRNLADDVAKGRQEVTVRLVLAVEELANLISR